MKPIREMMLWASLGVVGGAASLSMGQPVHELWASKCVGCHGERGLMGDGEGLAASSDWLGEEDGALFEAVLRHGDAGGPLPAFDDGTLGSELTAAEAWALVNHLREFQERARREREATPSPGAGGVFGSDHHGYRVETVIGDGLDTPWSVDWLGDGSMLLSERGGTLSVVDVSGERHVVGGTPAVVANGQGGLMDVAVHVEEDGEEWVYLSYSHGIRRGAMTRVVRGKLDLSGRAGYLWSNERLVWEADADDYLEGGLHFGCRLVFDGEGHVFFSIGERGRGDHAQDLTRPNGKVHRVGLDGSVPDDNPFVGEDGGVYGSIWSYGHRNPQGLAMDDHGVLWDTEHGPRGGDEVNVVERGGNYGWPLVSFGMNYSGKPLEAPWPGVVGVEGEMVMPVFRWLPSIAACGLDVVTDRGRGMMFSEWRGDLLAGGLAGQSVERLRSVDGVLTEREELLRGIGRVRDVAVGPGGAVYVVLNGPDKVIRLVEAE